MRARLVIALAAFLGMAILPPFGQALAEPQACRLGANLEDIYDVDIARDTFGAVLWVWTLCPSDAVDPLASTTFPTATSAALGEILDIDTGGRGVYHYRRVQGTFRNDWDMSHYPFDRQAVTIPLDETRLGADIVLFEPDTVGSFLTPDILRGRQEWTVGDYSIATSVSEEDQTYGLPNLERARYARGEVSFTLTRTGFVTFLKLSAGVFAASIIALMMFFYDPRDPRAFGSRLGLLVGTLFAVLVNLRTADSVIGDMGRVTLVTEIHLAALALIVILAVLALRDWWRAESALPVPYPNWLELGITGGLFVAVVAALILRAAGGT